MQEQPDSIVKQAMLENRGLNPAHLTLDILKEALRIVTFENVEVRPSGEGFLLTIDNDPRDMVMLGILIGNTPDHGRHTTRHNVLESYCTLSKEDLAIGLNAMAAKDAQQLKALSDLTREPSRAR